MADSDLVVDDMVPGSFVVRVGSLVSYRDAFDTVIRCRLGIVIDDRINNFVVFWDHGRRVVISPTEARLCLTVEHY